ncbi:protein valois [Scaptodrosophila lebanonensis]|uniref:Protein valois n=1 Tax=Drosophila lebanonensis TaxID=7225 RepID=A0A6J2TQ34_DROLE|nr:protein valois [Scaptodrosophila lebanonensis]
MVPINKYKDKATMFPQRSSVTYRTPDFHKPPPAIELADNVEYPNLNVTDMNARLENVSPRIHECWDSLTMNKRQHVALATNRRDGAQWWGMFFGYNHLKHMTVDNANYKLQCEFVVNILRFAYDNVLLVALGDTRLQAWSTYSTVRNPAKPYSLFLVGEAAGHNIPINQLNVFKSNEKCAISTCSEGTINVWDLAGADLTSSFRIRTAHTERLMGLATSATSDKQFLTCDRGGCARLWDVREASLASTCMSGDEALGLSFTCAAWAAPTELHGDNYIYLGDYDGNVHTLDIRVPLKFVETKKFFEEGHVSHLLVNGCHLAATSNLPSEVKIEKISGDRQFVYTYKEPHNRLTDALWQGDRTLVTIGYGRKLVKHVLPKSGQNID